MIGVAGKMGPQLRSTVGSGIGKTSVSLWHEIGCMLGRHVACAGGKGSLRCCSGSSR